MAERVVLAMSGGVDSSVAALLLREAGYQVIGLFMRTGTTSFDPSGPQSGSCCSVHDAHDAQRVADRLDIPFQVLDYQNEFQRIKDEFISEYLEGRTPNPCVSCNVWLKFGSLWRYGQSVGAELVATGHHARIRQGADGTVRIARAVDREKDQSYVLSCLSAEVLPRMRLPVGELTKAEVRALARESRLPVHDKAESQEICFIPSNDYRSFVRDRRGDRDTSGTIRDEQGHFLGKHEGIEAYTIGQRRGLGACGGGEPRYVVEIEPGTGTVVVGPKASLERKGLAASRMSWQGQPPAAASGCLAQIRSRHKASPATVEALPGGRAHVWFTSPQTAIAPGQVVAIYQDDLVWGGGWIDEAIGGEEGN